ncbi:hypothetical protein [Nostoc sp.]|uniref:hypothetical protein n=1 Tax=Nostoc sp. TaxID=1180 RepID=UPI002FFAEE5D
MRQGKFYQLELLQCFERETYRRQFHRQFDFAQFNAEVIIAATAENHLMIAVIDCSFIAKSGKTTFGLYHFSRVLA